MAISHRASTLPRRVSTPRVEIVPPLPAHAATDMASDTVTWERAAAVFKALSDPLRLQLVAMAGSAQDGAVCFCDVAARVDMPQSSLSHHMRVLVDAGILKRERRGTWSWYRVCEEPFHLLLDVLRPGGVLTPSSTCFDSNEPHQHST